MLEGGNEPIEIDGRTVTMIGTSANSEAITVLVTALKALHMAGVSVSMAMELAAARHTEQYERYHSDDQIL